MEIKTKFNRGDKLWRIEHGKARQFVVDCIHYDGAVYYGDTRYDMMLESECFATKEELIEYITSDD